MRLIAAITSLCLTCCVSAWALAAEGRVDNKIFDPRTYEEGELKRLEMVEKDSANTLAEFSTDGCSGGLSEGWATLGRNLPAFREKFGARPPFEYCCVAHDKAYWRGETVHGYDKRLQADQTLRECVLAYGKTEGVALASSLNLTKTKVVNDFVFISDAMFYAVRVGGAPCSIFPWRWGYGWPRCEDAEKTD